MELTLRAPELVLAAVVDVAAEAERVKTVEVVAPEIVPEAADELLGVPAEPVLVPVRDVEPVVPLEPDEPKVVANAPKPKPVVAKDEPVVDVPAGLPPLQAAAPRARVTDR